VVVHERELAGSLQVIVADLEADLFDEILPRSIRDPFVNSSVSQAT